MQDVCEFNVWEWQDLALRARIGSSAKLVAFCLAKHADRDGTRSHPGVALLVAYTQLDWKTVTGALRTLREVGLVERVRSGRGRSSTHADEYRLVVPQQDEAGYLGDVACPMPAEIQGMARTIRAKRKGQLKVVDNPPIVEPSPVEKLGSEAHTLGVGDGPLPDPLGPSEAPIGVRIPPYVSPPTYPNNQEQVVSQAVTGSTREASSVDEEGWPAVARQFRPPTDLPAPPPGPAGRCSSHPWVPTSTDPTGCAHCAREQASERAGSRYLRLASGA
jgi:DNA-binding transcriptional ArsR family regulator